MNSFDDLEPGDVVSVRFAGVLRHYGVVTFGGRIVSNSQRHGGVISQTLAEFSDGKRVRRHGQADRDLAYLSHHRAHRHLGADYHLTGSNCIDYSRRALGKRPTPWQVGRALLMAVSDMGRPRR